MLMHPSLALSGENWKNTTVLSANIPQTRRRRHMNEHVARERHHGAIVAAYRVERGWSQQRLANELEVDLTTVQRMEQLPMIKNVSRRWFLIGLLGIPAALLDLEGESPHIESVRLTLNADPMTYHENILELYWELYRRGGPLSVTPRLNVWMQEITAFEQAAQGTVWHKRALAVLAMSYQLQGSVARSIMNYSAAHAAYRQAVRIAKELDDTELMASALAREGMVWSWEDKPFQAIPLYNGALEMITGSGLPNLRGSILQNLSESHAQTKQSSECWRSIGLAEKAIDNRDHRQERSRFLFNTALMTSQKGANALFLGDY